VSGKLRDQEIRKQILDFLKKRKYRFAEEERDISALIWKLRITPKGMVEKAIRHIEAGKDLKRVILKKQESSETCEIAYEWMKFKILGTKVYFKVKFIGKDENCMVKIITCKEKK
jgi:hypothetical protein